jgi:hypothetical protein
MIVDILYEVVGSYPHTVDLDEYEDDILEKYGKPWEELSDSEKDEFIYDLGHELYQVAESESEYSLGQVESWEDENYKQHYFND